MSVRPNILWYCADQQRYDTIRATGQAHIRTPGLDALCARGVAFRRAYSQSQICTPSRASFLTGRYPATHHVYRNGNATFPAHEKLVTRLLADAGYDCGLVGKLHLSAAKKIYDLQRDPGEFDNLWDDPGARELKTTLLKNHLDAMMASVSAGPPRAVAY